MVESWKMRGLSPERTLLSSFPGMVMERRATNLTGRREGNQREPQSLHTRVLPAGGVGRGRSVLPPSEPASERRAEIRMRPGEDRPLEGGAPDGVSELELLELLELLKLRAAERIDEAAERLGALSRAIWSEPELAYEEHSAHGVLTSFFQQEPPFASWSVQPHYQLPTAFRAEWAPPGGLEPGAEARALQLGFLCEYDALPGIGHACGHNLIAEVGAAAALGLRAALESLPGPPPVKVFGDQ